VGGVPVRRAVSEPSRRLVQPRDHAVLVYGREVIDVATSIEIDRPADDVFAFVSEFPNNPRWQRGQVSCSWTSDPPLRVGSTYDQHARFLGRDMVNHFEVIEHELEGPGRQ